MMEKRLAETKEEKELLDLCLDFNDDLSAFLKLMVEGNITNLNFYSASDEFFKIGGDNVLHLAICNDCFKIIDFLISTRDETGLDINAMNHVEVTPLGYSVQDDTCLEVTKRLLEIVDRKSIRNAEELIGKFSEYDENLETRKYLKKFLKGKNE